MTVQRNDIDSTCMAHPEKTATYVPFGASGSGMRASGNPAFSAAKRTFVSSVRANC